jgi:aspartate/methionine/tyrosine aminotransferase
MTTPDRHMQSDYMNFAKLGTRAPYNLASSGVADCALSDFDLTLDDLALSGPSTYGFGPLIERVAARFGLDPKNVAMPGGGCSFANHLAFAALLAPGDEVLVEDPIYELLTSTLGYLQARIRRFQRDPAAGWRLDPDAVAAALTPQTRLVVMTNLHNPSGALADPAEIAAVAEAAARVGAKVLIDEVYLELMFRDGGARTAFRPDGDIIVTSSLTKAYGLTGLRCGWILAPAADAERMRRLNDLFGVHPPHISERMAVVAFDKLERFRARANAMIDPNRAAYREILGGHPGLDQTVFDQGTTVFPRIVAGDADALVERLRSRLETGVVPGRFFGRPDRVRIGLAGDIAMTRTGLERIAEALRI